MAEFTVKGLLFFVLMLQACAPARPKPEPTAPLHIKLINLPQGKLPYPDARAPDDMPCMAPAQDSDCGGVIAIMIEDPRLGTWAIGDADGEAFSPYLFFNTAEDARDCAGSSSSEVRQMTYEGWK